MKAGDSRTFVAFQAEWRVQADQNRPISGRQPMNNHFQINAKSAVE